MTDRSPLDPVRHGNRAQLANALERARARTLELFAAFEAALPAGLGVPYAAALNPPLWELGHVGWFEDHWIARNPQRLQGHRADPAVARSRGSRRGAAALYDSSHVPHGSRWQLALPDANATRRDLARTRERTLRVLADTPQTDAALYFFRLVLAHECMHAEAAVYMAQALGLPLGDAAPGMHASDGAGSRAHIADDAELTLEGGPFRMGSSASGGFAFDNELGAHDVMMAPFAIDARAVTWARYLPFVEAGGYGDERWWSAEGRAWLTQSGATQPPHLRRDGDGWQCQRFGQWLTLDEQASAVHLTPHEAQAWCRWAGRRLPGEAEWEFAALHAGPGFVWGEVWEWTASAFVPYPGFTPHPYRDYSQPWVDGRPVLRGASHATAAEMRHARYRNYFEPTRNDVFAGFRSCAASG